MLSYLIPQLGSLLETGIARRLLKVLLILAHIILAAAATYILSGWLGLITSALISIPASTISYIILRKILL